ncbi:hypothetical protein [Pantoea piersonii]|uniref:hypothetical protein n=1 Tax=Pantoea TaxID=53335 RepID=UPI0028A899C2|nr:hypothetical protein [Pantoea piersonii]
MKQRYSYIRSWEELEQAYKSIVNFAVEQAKAHDVELRVCVNNKQHCEQYITKAVGENAFKQLRSNRTIQIKSVSASLHSSTMLKKDYLPPSAVYLLFFPSSELLEVVEKLSDVKTMIVFSENDDHTEATDEWQAFYEVTSLKPADQ